MLMWKQSSPAIHSTAAHLKNMYYNGSIAINKNNIIILHLIGYKRNVIMMYGNVISVKNKVKNKNNVKGTLHNYNVVCVYEL